MEILRSSSFALPSIAEAVAPYRRIYGVSSRMRGFVVGVTAAQEDSGDANLDERTPAVPLIMTLIKFFLLRG
jgi:hypothetical protein